MALHLRFRLLFHRALMALQLRAHGSISTCFPKADGFMDLSVEWISDDRIAIAHYGEQNGDLMADPDMTLIVDNEAKTLMPATFQNDYVGVYQEVYTDDGRWMPRLSRELTSFLSTWLKNIEFQGHILKEARYFDEEMSELPIVFDESGKEYGFDIPHDILSMAELENKRIEEPETANTEANTQIVEKDDISDSLLLDDGSYQPLFKEILKQGNVSKTGKQKIYELINDTSSIELLIDDLKNIYGDFWSEVNFDEETIKWHVDERGLDVFINGLDNEKLHYTWSEMTDGIINLVNSGEYFEKKKALETRLYEGMTVSLENRTYSVESLDFLNNKIELRDITFAEGTGFPIFRKEYLDQFENELEQDGFFDRLKKEENTLQPTEEKKINFHITDDNLGVGGAKEKYKRNIEAIKLLKTIESEERLATADEQAILSQYVGWGGLAVAFDEDNSSWSSEYAELKGFGERGRPGVYLIKRLMINIRNQTKYCD
jgi:hypothetical protein